MDLGWKVLIPLALGWFLLLGAIELARDESWDIGVVVGGGILLLLVGAGLLSAAIEKARLASEAGGSLAQQSKREVRR
jgi:NADH-quinone oxidoreductase subunit H